MDPEQLSGKLLNDLAYQVMKLEEAIRAIKRANIPYKVTINVVDDQSKSTTEVDKFYAINTNWIRRD